MYVQALSALWYYDLGFEEIQPQPQGEAPRNVVQVPPKRLFSGYVRAMLTMATLLSLSLQAPPKRLFSNYVRGGDLLARGLLVVVAATVGAGVAVRSAAAT